MKNTLFHKNPIFFSYLLTKITHLKIKYFLFIFCLNNVQIELHNNLLFDLFCDITYI